ncbi:DUF2621 domain-containing protein [Gracilibacillus caseinilyticus]|uniref:DUF2621 domain-containing protein n=1 Tax=Gracilibacillus caseinilyticus TaxID=2932256 RepID=A0ABY4EU32_9BACI|nr:DUF2621 domain-containing protein [Gracilibacillus caseinilyticus]UOQ47728.1 DUF2621 domain-containing protein [Gracilibacillus caseinilyticus]
MVGEDKLSFEFMTFIVLWTFVLLGLIAIGGYFMFRKFLKSLPKDDGKSDLDWQQHYIDQSIHLWKDAEKQFLEELVAPVPELFRDVARQKIAGKIGQIALEKNEQAITQETLIQGYIMATPKRDHKFLRKKLKEKEIDVTPYERFFQFSPEDYQNKKYAARTR